MIEARDEANQILIRLACVEHLRLRETSKIETRQER